ncbi:MAG: hypothetical protein ABII71_00605 [Candidatus Micrarchaeota archaeon]
MALVLTAAIMGCGQARPSNPGAGQNLAKAVLPAKEASAPAKRTPSRKQGAPGLFECTSKDLNWRNRLHTRLIKGLVEDALLPIPVHYCRGDADQILRGSIRDIKNILSKKLNPGRANPGDIIIVAIRLESDGRMGFLFGNHLKRSHQGVLPDGRKSFRYQKADTAFPVEEINAALKQSPSAVRPPKPAMASIRFKVGNSGEMFRYR